MNYNEKSFYNTDTTDSSGRGGGEWAWLYQWSTGAGPRHLAPWQSAERHLTYRQLAKRYAKVKLVNCYTFLQSAILPRAILLNVTNPIIMLFWMSQFFTVVLSGATILGIKTFSITTLSITTLSITIINIRDLFATHSIINPQQSSTLYQKPLSWVSCFIIVMLNAIMLNVIILSVDVLYVMVPTLLWLLIQLQEVV